MSVIGSNVLAGASGQSASGGGGGGAAISRSLRFNSGDSAYLSRTPSAAGNSKTWTLSFWAKRAGLAANNCIFMAYNGSSISEDNYATIQLNNDDTFRVGYAYASYKTTTRVFRDPSAWYHIVVVIDTTNSTAGDRVQIYVNGTKETSFSATHDPDLNQDLAWNRASFIHRLGSEYNQFYSNIYLADVHFIDGQALAPTDFGETNTNNLWVPIAYAGTYGASVDQSQTWSNGVSTTRASNPATNGFDGNDASAAVAPSSTPLTITFSGGLTVSSKIEGTGLAPNILINEGMSDETSVTVGAGYQTIYSGSITIYTLKLSYTGNAASGCFNALKVDGKMLVDSGISLSSNGFRLEFADSSSNAALGTDTSGVSPANTWTVNNLSAAGSAWNQSKIWSNESITSTGSVWSSPPDSATLVAANLYDSSLSTYVGPYSGGTLTVPFGQTFSGTKTFRVYWEPWVAGETIKDQSANTLYTTSGAFKNWVSFTGTDVSALVFTSGSSGNSSNVYAIEVDGNLLVDSSISDPLAVNIDSLFDTPTNGDTASDNGAGGEITGCYATLNPLHQLATATLANGNLQTTSSNPAFSTFLLKSGKWYCEHTVTATGYNLCFSQIDHPSGATPSSSNSKSIGWYTNGTVYYGAGSTSGAGSYAAGDVLGAAIDMDNSTIKLYKNGTLTITIDFSTGTYHRFAEGMYVSQFNGTGHFNFGQRAFANSNVPSGYKSLNTSNLSSTIADGSKYFDTKLYTGNSGTQSLTMPDSEMSPGFVWLKERSASGDHELFDSIRGVHKYLESNSTNAESTSTTTLTSFDSNGFTLGSSSLVNDNNVTYAAWAWDAGSSNTTIAAGSLNSSLYNQSDNWSSRVTGTPFSGYSVATMFDGSASGICYANTGSSITFTPTTPITVTSSIRIYGAQSSSTEFIKINDNAATNVPSNVGWFTPDTGTAITSLSKLEFYTTNGSYASGVGAIEIDGKLLVDASVSITTPSIASTVRSSPESGFSIVTYTGGAANSTVGHGLNAEPYVIICKSRTQNSAGWDVYHRSIGKDKFLILNQNYAEGVYSNHWGTSGPDSTTFGVSQANYFNNHGDMVALCFAPVEGYSAMGSYVGNGSADGPFVFTGFKTAWLMVKSSSNSGEHWLILDAARDSYNVADATIYANLNNAEAEASALGIDILSNGFKPRGTNAGTNASGYTYIYLAFASHPFASNGGLAR